MRFKCKICNKISTREDWNKTTKEMCGERFTVIEKGYNNINWYYICPNCYNFCYNKNIELITII